VLTSIYLVIPARRPSWRHALVGAFTATVLWEITRHVLVWYFGTLSQINVVYSGRKIRVRRHNHCGRSPRPGIAPAADGDRPNRVASMRSDRWPRRSFDKGPPVGYFLPRRGRCALGNDPPGKTRKLRVLTSLSLPHPSWPCPSDPVFPATTRSGGSQSGGGHLDGAGPLCAQ
jgi:hypothetical protein